MENIDCITCLFENLSKPMVWEVEEWNTLTVLLLCLKTYENLWFSDVEEWKTLIVLLLCWKTYEHQRFWEVEEWNTLIALFVFENLRKPKVLAGRRMEHFDCICFFLKTYENQWFGRSKNGER